MADSNDLRIKVTAHLDKEASTKLLQKHLDEIAGNLKLKVAIDDKQIKEIKNLMNDIQKQTSKQSKGVKIIDDDNLGTTKKIYTDVDNALKEFQKLGQVKINKIFDPATQELKAFNLEIQKTDGLIEKLKFETTGAQGVNGVDGFMLSKREEIDKRSIEMQKALTQTIQQRAQEERRLEEAQAKAVNKNIELTQKEKQLQEQLNKEIERQVRLYQETKKIQRDDLVRRYGDSIDTSALNSQMSKVMSIDPSAISSLKQLKVIQDDVDLGFKKISSSVKSSSTHVLGFAEAFQTAMVKFCRLV